MGFGRTRVKVKQNPTKTARGLVPESDYQAILSAIERFSNAFEERLSFKFTIKDGPYTGAIVEHSTADRFTPSSKLANLVGTLLDRSLTAQDFSEGMDLDCLKGTVCQVTVIHKTDPAGTPYTEISRVTVSQNDLNGQERQTGQTHAKAPPS